MNAIDTAVSREVARLETWLACYAIDARVCAKASPPRRADIADTFASCHQTLSTIRASERGL